VKITVKTVEAPAWWEDPIKAARDLGLALRGELPKLTEVAESITRDRVRQEGTGPDGMPIAGYSTRPTWVSQFSGLKPKRRPRHGRVTQKLNNRNNWVGLYDGGYREYRQKAGMRVTGFHFENFGTAWRYWGKIGPRNFKRLPNGGFIWRLDVGFRRMEDAIAAGEAEKKRPRMFQIGPNEADVYATQFLFPTFFALFKRFFG